ncbi:MAG: TetR/AcrR family transcriptional regulator [Chloroflexota bacterium]
MAKSHSEGQMLLVDAGQITETARPSLRERQRAEREQLILHEAERLLREEGYDGLVMDRLAEQVGISKGTIYQHFDKKEALVGAIILRGLERISEQLAIQRADSERPAAPRLEAILTLLVEESTAWMSIITSPKRHELAAALGDHPGLRDARTRFFDGLRTLILQGQERGEFDPAIPAPIAARFLLSLVGARAGFAQPGDPVLPGEEFAALAVRFYFHGLSLHPVEELSA